jgi:Leucine Rich Repeat (LRR) protein
MMTRFLLSLGLIFGFTSQCIAQTSPSEGVSAEERQALIALYNATDGEHWKNNTHWMGKPGTECVWYGVECGQQPNGEDHPLVVDSLNLSENNLKGSIPEAVDNLTHLEWLDVRGNSLSGLLPQPLIRKILSGSLWVVAEPPLFTSVSEIDFEDSPSALLCGRHRIIFRSDESAIEYDVRCRNATPDDRTTFCEVRHGKIFGSGFARLAHTIDKNGFYSLRPKYNRNITEGDFVSTRVIRGGKAYEVVDYAGAGPFELWTIEITIDGVASTMDSDKSTTQPKCPRWDDSRVRQEK